MAVWDISTVPFCVASRTCNAGTISPAAGFGLKLVVIRLGNAWKISHAPYNVSTLLRPARRQPPFDSGIDCATAGAATAVAAIPTPATFRNSRVSLGYFLLDCAPDAMRPVLGMISRFAAPGPGGPQAREGIITTPFFKVNRNYNHLA
jgi:hypothetical protein